MESSKTGVTKIGIDQFIFKFTAKHGDKYQVHRIMPTDRLKYGISGKNLAWLSTTDKGFSDRRLIQFKSAKMINRELVVWKPTTESPVDGVIVHYVDGGLTKTDYFLSFTIKRFNALPTYPRSDGNKVCVDPMMINSIDAFHEELDVLFNTNTNESISKITAEYTPSTESRDDVDGVSDMSEHNHTDIHNEIISSEDTIKNAILNLKRAIVCPNGKKYTTIFAPIWHVKDSNYMHMSESGGALVFSENVYGVTFIGTAGFKSSDCYFFSI
jgi:hypothetical protein